MLLAVKCAMISIDRLTVRDCARGIKGACEEMRRLDLKSNSSQVERLQLTKDGASKLNLK